MIQTHTNMCKHTYTYAQKHTDIKPEDVFLTVRKFYRPQDTSECDNNKNNINLIILL